MTERIIPVKAGIHTGATALDPRCFIKLTPREDRDTQENVSTLPFVLVSLKFTMYLTWQFGVDDPENAKNFSTIAEWWKSLQAQEVLLKQRLIPEEGSIDWTPQKFDEHATFFDADVRGITFYWRKDESGDSSNTTPAKLEFAPALQRLYVYPENQEKLVISVEVSEPIQKAISIENPDWFSERARDSAGNVTRYRLRIRDHISQTEITILLDEEHLNVAKQAIDEL